MAEHIPPAVSRAELGVAVLRFIGQTSAFEEEFKRRRESGQFIPRFVYLDGFRPYTPTSIVTASRQSINACLRQLGGIPASFDDTATGVSMECRLMAWQGNHPKQEGQHIWKAAFPRRGMHELTMESGAIQELMLQFTASGIPDTAGAIASFQPLSAREEEKSRRGYL